VAISTVLFLCTGNYYRSRFAEEVFNHRAANASINWQAQSRALAIERGVNNVGPISPLAVRGLSERGLIARASNRPPQQCTIADLEAAKLVVALNESEHRPLMLERFPDWVAQIEYWKVGDLDRASPSVALALIDTQISALLERL
jgi:protein-tyrosine phosphatase